MNLLHTHPENEYPEQMVNAMAVLPDQLETAFRDVGLYSPSVHWHEEERPTLIMEFIIGDVAFTNRVQSPDQFGIDHEFSLMTRGLVTDEFESIRRELEGQ